MRAEPPRSTSARTVLRQSAVLSSPDALGRAFQLALEGFVNLYDLAATTHRGKAAIAHGFADTVREKPRRLVLDLQNPVELVRADAFL